MNTITIIALLLLAIVIAYAFWRISICHTCKKPFIYGVNGVCTYFGEGLEDYYGECDRCAGVVRDSNGEVIIND